MNLPYYPRRLAVHALLALTALAMGCTSPPTAGNPEPTAASTHITEVTAQQEIDALVHGDASLVLVDFHASWCGPCKLLAPELQALASAYPTQIKIVTVDVDAAPELAQRYAVQSIPHLVLLRHGQPPQSRTGFATQDVLAKWTGLMP